MRAWLALLSCSALACQSSSSPSVGPTSGVDAGDEDQPRYMTDLTESERETLCNWTANVGGGYGKTFTCDGGLVVSNFATLQDCLNAFLGACDNVSVSDWETCRDKEVTDECALYLYTAPECANVVRCLGETDGGPAPEPDAGDAGEGGM